MQTALGETNRRSVKPPSQLTHLDDVLRLAYAAIHRGDLATFLQIHAQNGIKPRIETLVEYGRRALWKGDLDDGLMALRAANAKPLRDDLIACCEAASDLGDSAVAQRARELAAELRG